MALGSAPHEMIGLSLFQKFFVEQVEEFLIQKQHTGTARANSQHLRKNTPVEGRHSVITVHHANGPVWIFKLNNIVKMK